jgi:hypothetical protein
MSEANENIPAPLMDDLEVVCVNCRGAGGWSGSARGPAWTACGRCGGSGYVTTEVGRKVLDLIRHNLKLLLHDADQG